MEENSKIIRKKIFENLIISIAIMLYFIIINFSYIRMQEKFIMKGIKYVSLAIVFFSIAIFEFAYRKDSYRLALNGIEILVLACLTLIAENISQIIHIDFKMYILFLSLIFLLYYVIKSITIYTLEKRKYLKSLSDIHEIVAKEPIKKQAKKRE